MVKACLTKKRIHVFPYLYEWLLRGQSREEILSYIYITLCFLDCLSLILNTGKSTLVPTQKIEFIGFLIDTEFESIPADGPFPDNSPPLSRSAVSTFHHSLDVS